MKRSLPVLRCLPAPSSKVAGSAHSSLRAETASTSLMGTSCSRWRGNLVHKPTMPRCTACSTWSRTRGQEGPRSIDWFTVGEAGVDQRTSDLSPVIQEIVDRAGWVEGNAVVIIVTGSRVAESYNGDNAAAPLLHVEDKVP